VENPKPALGGSPTALEKGASKLPTTTIKNENLEKQTDTPAEVTRSGRDLRLLPDSATYYFVIHVLHPTVNLAPSRLGIGQFNRSKYAGNPISHQVKSITGESQLIYIGPFMSYEEVKQYQIQLGQQLEQVMKVPSDVYETFVITEDKFGTLSDFESVEEYTKQYERQPR